MNNWYAITGGNASGKTTLIDILAKRGYHTVPEAARILIDQAAERGVSSAELRADEWQFHLDVIKLKAKLEQETTLHQITIFDRGMQDALAYDRYYKRPQPEWVMELMQKSRYRQVFLLDPLPQYTADYSRTEDEEFAKNIAAYQFQAYADYGMTPVRVPVLATPEARADYVEALIQADQQPENARGPEQRGEAT